jgi:hypothetical protein
MSTNFSEIMASKSDTDLIEIVTKLKNDYQPEAVKAAESEMQSRNLSVSDLEKVKEGVQKKEKALIERENEPLGIIQKILFLIFFWGIIPWAMASTFKNDGYKKKYKDAWKFMKIGIAIFIGIPALLLFIFNLAI